VKRDSPACQALSAELVRRGYDATPEQLERWDKAGLLPPVTPPRRGLGRGKGREIAQVYPPESIERISDQVADLCQLAGRGRSLQTAALILFARDRYVSPDTLRAALRQQLKGIQHARENPEKLVRVVRAQEHRLIAWIDDQAIRDAFDYLCDSNVSATVLGDLIGASQIDEMAERLARKPAPKAIAPTITDMDSFPRIGEMLALVDQISMRELEQARDIVTGLLRAYPDIPIEDGDAALSEAGIPLAALFIAAQMRSGRNTVSEVLKTASQSTTHEGASAPGATAGGTAPERGPPKCKDSVPPPTTTASSQPPATEP
jgi:hypothetical protein